MKSLVLALALSFALPAVAQNQKPVTLRSILLEQLRTTHKTQDWFVPPSLAIAGVTAEQATWTDKAGNHSIGQLANHLLFWDSPRTCEIRRACTREIRWQQRRDLQQL